MATALAGDSVRDLIAKIVDNQAAAPGGGGGDADTLAGVTPTTVGLAFVGLTNPSAVTFARINADNTVTALSAADMRTALGVDAAGSGVTSAIGTAGQISVSGATGAVTFSLPSALTGIQSITGGAANFLLVAGTGNSRTITLQTTTSGGVATTALTIGATQNAAFVGSIDLGASSQLTFATRSKLRSGADGNIQLGNNGNTDFALLQFGGTTSSFPSLKRSGAILQARLGDDSAFTALQGTIQLAAAAVTGLGAGVLAALTNASLVLTDSTGQVYRIPAII